MPLTSMPKSLLVGNDNLAFLDSNNDVVGVLAVNSATNRVGGTEDFTNTTREVLGERLVGHLTGNLESHSVWLVKNKQVFDRKTKR